jgi:hypothetical protein
LDFYDTGLEKKVAYGNRCLFVKILVFFWLKIFTFFENAFQIIRHLRFKPVDPLKPEKERVSQEE